MNNSNNKHNTKKGFIFMLHNIEPYSYRFNCSNLYENLTITKEFLEETIVNLKQQHWNFVSMETFLQNKKDDKTYRNIVITIDDGWKGVYSNAFPIFQKYSIPFVFYVATDLIDNGFKNCELPELDGMNILCDYINKKEDNKEIKQQLFKKFWKKFKYRRRLLFWQNNYTILQNMCKDYPIDFNKYKNESICSVQELKIMINSGLCELGSHTHNHIHMSRISKKKQLKQFIISKQKIEDISGKQCRYFSYPYGHFNSNSDQAVRNIFDSATIVKPTKFDIKNKYVISRYDDIYRIPRILINMNMKKNFLETLNNDFQINK